VSLRAVRLLAAVPLVAALALAVALAAWPEGDVTARERELVARLTRSGVQRLDTDGGHWALDATDLADHSAPAPATARPHLLAAAVITAPAAPVQWTALAPPAVRRAATRVVPSSVRDRAPPRR